MFIFSPWIPDINFKYNLGLHYSKFLLTITVINFLGIIHETFKSIRLACKMKKLIKEKLEIKHKVEKVKIGDKNYTE